jgi:hypothetical protein
MSKLRDQLQQARSDYESARYPGDLADEVLSRRQIAAARWFFPMLVSGAVAAALALVVIYRTTEPTTTPGNGPVIVDTGSPGRVQAIAFQGRVPLTLPVAPFMATTPPMSVSLTSFSENLGVFQQPYEDLGPRLMQNLQKGLGVPQRGSVKERQLAPTPATHESA